MAGDPYYELQNLHAQDAAVEAPRELRKNGRPVDPKSGLGPPPSSPGYLTKDQADALKEDVACRLDEYGWGTYGPDGTGKLNRLPYSEMTREHLENVIITCAGWLRQDQLAAMLVCLRKAKKES